MNAILFKIIAKLDDAMRRFQAFIDLGDQRHADAVVARVDAVRIARQIAAGQYGDIILRIQSLRELCI